MTLRALIQYAYGLQQFERVEGSQGVLDEQFVVVARLEGPLTAARVDSPSAVRRLLAERFNLRVQFDEEVQRVAVLRRTSQDRLGPGLRLASTDCSRTLTASEERARDEAAKKGELRQRLCDEVALTSGRLHAIVSSMSRLATALAWYMQSPVVDETGLMDGPYEVDTMFDPASLVAWRSQSIEGLAPFHSALRADLGLKLETERRPVRLLIVEYVEQPTPN